MAGQTLVHFADAVQAAVGAHELRELSAAAVIERVADAIEHVESGADFAVSRGIAAAVSLRLVPGSSQEGRTLLRMAIEAPDAGRTARQLRAVARTCDDGVTPLAAIESPACGRIVRIIRRNARNPRLTLAGVARLCDLSPWRLCHILHTHGSTYRRELRLARMLEACEMMRDPHLPLKEVVFRCGYGNATSLFARHFRATLGLSPTSFRQQLQT